MWPANTPRMGGAGGEVVRAAEEKCKKAVRPAARAALDVALKRRMQDLVIEASRALRFAALFITHDLMEAVRIAHRVAVMDAHGRGIAGERAVPGAPGLVALAVAGTLAGWSPAVTAYLTIAIRSRSSRCGSGRSRRSARFPQSFPSRRRSPCSGGCGPPPGR